QPDPIGIAGGLNSYGFANGDPVNFSDPFGLCTPWPDCLFQSAADWGAQRGGAVGSAVLNGAAAANAAAEAFGANGLGQAVAEGDAVGGVVALAGMVPAGRAAGAAGRPALSTVKRALADVHAQVGKLPKGAPGKFGSPQRGNTTKGYRVDPAHPNAKPGTPEAGWHINWWDWSGGKRGSGGRYGAEPIP
ncbi:MAG: hypothetical protein WD802_07885, partial [Gemmatimonadaceae bacterium]